MYRCLVASAVLCLACSPPEGAVDPAPAPQPPPREIRVSAINGTGKNLYWGDLHTHTAYSADAFSFKNRATPADAYLFARGLSPLTIAAGAVIPGPVVQLSRPLDFDAVTDHSEFLVTTSFCGADENGTPYFPGNPDFNSQTCQDFRSTFTFGANPHQEMICPPNGNLVDCPSKARSAWLAVQQDANAAYVPGTFTTFSAYEWTGRSVPGDYTVHRNVIFSGTNVPDVPFDSQSYPAAADLWSALDTGCGGSPCDALTILHNSNISGGHAFDIPGPGPGNPAVVSQMIRYQRLMEVFQHKGSSECYFDQGSPEAMYNDPDCKFEKTLIAGSGSVVPDSRDSYVRTALATGITRESNHLGNPFRAGLVGATDTHNATSGNVDEATWPGHAGIADRQVVDRLNAAQGQHNPGGITGVWATENTRPAIFQALHDRESFATSGPRIAVRFYQTSNPTQFCVQGAFPDNILGSVPAPVPMGGTFNGSPGAKYFVISATKDVADLARVDLIKIDVSNGQRRSWVARFTLNGNPSVNGSNLSTSAPCLWGVDPTYDPAAPAVYYARVLEVPTPRWAATACNALAPANRPAVCNDATVNTNIQERAWTSPIWSIPP